MQESDRDHRRWLLDLDETDRTTFLQLLDKRELGRFRKAWFLWARPEQRPPIGLDWHTWLVCAGRGFGKTRAGAEWVREIARQQPDARIVLVGATLAEARSVMVQGESGVLACSPVNELPAFQPSLGRLTWSNGAQAQLYSAAEPESLRGPQFSHVFRASPEGILRK